MRGTDTRLHGIFSYDIVSDANGQTYATLTDKKNVNITWIKRINKTKKKVKQSPAYIKSVQSTQAGQRLAEEKKRKSVNNLPTRS